MSNISVVSYILVKPGEPLPPLRSHPLPDGKRGPKGRLMAYYGNKSVLAVLQEARTKAQAAGLDLVRIDLLIDGGGVPLSVHTTENLPDSKFLKLTKMDVKLAGIVYQILAEKGDKPDSLLGLLARQPSRLNKLWEDPRFSHLSLITWPVPIPGQRAGTVLQVAAISSPDIIERYDIRSSRAGEVEEMELVIQP